ncbi:hypothetical protein JS562_37575 [Agrobacterium sp. S2]|nr:hypothetical protein [Agrobacterium sp. S2]
MKPETVMIEEYLAMHGARRFEQGTSSGIHWLAPFLAEYGYEVAGAPHGGVKVRRGKGLWRRMSMPGLIALADEIRIAQGLQPFSAAHKQAA